MPRGVGKQPIAGLARRRGQSGRGFGSLPDDDAMSNTEPGTQTGDLLRFRDGIRAQPMIHRDGEQPGRRDGTVEVIFQENQKRGRITAARNGGHGALAEVDMREKRMFRKRPDMRHQHEASARSCLTRSLSALVASG